MVTRLCKDCKERPCIPTRVKARDYICSHCFFQRKQRNYLRTLGRHVWNKTDPEYDRFEHMRCRRAKRIREKAI